MLEKMPKNWPSGLPTACGRRGAEPKRKTKRQEGTGSWRSQPMIRGQLLQRSFLVEVDGATVDREERGRTWFGLGGGGGHSFSAALVRGLSAVSA